MNIIFQDLPGKAIQMNKLTSSWKWQTDIQKINKPKVGKKQYQSYN